MLISILTMATAGAGIGPPSTDHQEIFSTTNRPKLLPGPTLHRPVSAKWSPSALLCSTVLCPADFGWNKRGILPTSHRPRRPQAMHVDSITTLERRGGPGEESIRHRQPPTEVLPWSLVCGALGVPSLPSVLSGRTWTCRVACLGHGRSRVCVYYLYLGDYSAGHPPRRSLLLANSRWPALAGR